MTQVNSRPIIAVTGSAGKSTTKEFIAGILEQRWKILKTRKNQNAASMTRANMKKFTSAHHAAVFEFGMRVPGEITKHCRAVKPTMSVITNIGSAHIGFVNGSVERLARAKSEIIIGMHQNGTVFINADNEQSKLLLLDRFAGTIVKIGIHAEADYRAENVQEEADGVRFTATWHENSFALKIPMLGFHNVYNALFAIAVADRLGFTPEEMQRGLINSYKHLQGTSRLSLYNRAYPLTIIDDTKNANPQATKAAIDVALKRNGNRTIIVFGNMLDLGSYTVEAHREVGVYIAQSNVSFLVTYGKFAKITAKAAIDAGMPKERVFQFITMQKMHVFLTRLIQMNDTVLVKGSYATKMKRTVRYLLAVYK